MNVVALANRFSTSSVKCCTPTYCIHARKGPVIIMNQLKSIYNRTFKDSYSYLIHICFPIIASNVEVISLMMYVPRGFPSSATT